MDKKQEDTHWIPNTCQPNDKKLLVKETGTKLRKLNMVVLIQS